jgi:hypothetical protein
MMPYAVSFTKRVPIPSRERYINDCCVGGDQVVDQLLPLVRARYSDIQTNQEDWGWFIWFRKGNVRLAIDVFTEDSECGTFRVHLTSRVKQFLILDAVVDTPELEELREIVEAELTGWSGHAVETAHLDREYMEDEQGH